MFVFDYHKRVRYGETDQMGYLYYGNYPLLYEIGRAESIRSLGISYKELEESLKVMMPVLEVKSRYISPLKYDENIKIRTLLKERPTKMIHFYHEIYGENEVLAHKGEVKLFFVDMTSNKRVSCPKYLSDKIEIYFD